MLAIIVRSQCACLRDADFPPLHVPQKHSESIDLPQDLFRLKL